MVRSGRWPGLVVVIAVLLGVAAGLLIGTRLTQAHSVGGPHERFVRPVAQSAPATDAERERMALIEARLRRLEARPEPSAVLAPQAPSPERAANDALTAEEAPAQRFLEQVKERRASHDGEPTDRAWAGRVAPSLQSDLLLLAASDAGNLFRVGAVECKTTSCAAPLSFPSFQAAADSASLLLHSPYSQRCGTTVFLPEPADRAAPYELTMFFECEETRR